MAEPIHDQNLIELASDVVLKHLLLHQFNQIDLALIQEYCFGHLLAE